MQWMVSSGGMKVQVPMSRTELIPLAESAVSATRCIGDMVSPGSNGIRGRIHAVAGPCSR